MEEYLDILREKNVDENVIDIVRKSVLVAEEYISTPKSGKAKLEVVSIVKMIYRSSEE